LRSDWGNKNYVTRQQGDVLRHVAQEQEIVEIEVGYGLSAAPDLDVAQRTLDRRATGGKQSRHQSAERTQRVASRTAGLPHHKHLNRPQLAHLHIQAEALVNVGD